ncbi:MAG: Mur ligase [Gemmatimonadales bacterium]|nr:Mur ligase [Gemmatimonadales bacterium]
MNLLDSRRLTGPGLLLDGPGAVLDVSLGGSDAEQLISAWRRAAERLLRDVGWDDERLAVRHFEGGVSLALTAPVDGLYAAAGLNERAWEAAVAELDGGPSRDYQSDLTALRTAISSENNPRLVELRRAARARGLTFLSGEDQVSVGSGVGALVWDDDALPQADAVDWDQVSDVPVALVTGSNGKTTVVRLLAAMLRESGLIPGFSSTDGVTAGTETIGEGDFSGPSGARLALRHPTVQAAILETARGGLLRRGLPVESAQAAVVTNVAEDHLGEFGIESLADLAETKLLVAKAVKTNGALVLNADDSMLVKGSAQLDRTIIWFSLDAGSPLVQGHVARGGTAVLSEDNEIVLLRAGQRRTIAPLTDVPITLRGTARHNVANALAAVGGGAALGLEPETMAAALRRFGTEQGDNAGRANLLQVGDIRVLLDYAHNPHGMLALVALAQKLPAQRRLVMVGQAGDRSDEAVRELARAVWPLEPHHVVIKEMDEYLRGRSLGEVPALLEKEFLRLGLAPSSISRTGPDMDGVRTALEWARPGDLLVLAVHQDRQPVLDLLNQLDAGGWQAGKDLPQRGL